MKIHYHMIGDKKITLAEVDGDLTGNSALGFYELLSAFLGKTDTYLLLDMKKTKRIDSMGLSELDKCFSPGIQTRLFNVSQDVRSFMSLAGNEHFLEYVYNEVNNEKALELFARELFQNTDIFNNKRKHPRVNTLIPATFKYHPGNSGVISGKAKILNLSEGGVLAGDIVAINTETGKTIERPALDGQELYDLEFLLPKDPQPIRTRGDCVRKIAGSGEFRLGVRFTEIGKGDQKKIRDYAIRVYIGDI